MALTPRDKFRSDRALTRGFNDTISSSQMQAALDAASLEMDLKLVVANDVTTAAANRWRKEGADLFRRILENLNSEAVAPTPITTSTLNHDT